MSDEPTTTNTTPAPQATPQPATPQGQAGGETPAPDLITMSPAQLKARLERDWEAERKRLLEDLGVESVDGLKSILTEAKQRKEAELSEVEKLTSQLADEKARNEKVQQQLEAVRLQQIADRRDSLIKELAKEAGAVDVEDVLLNVQKDNEALSKMVDKDGAADKKAIQTAIDGVKTAKPHLFSASVPGVPSSKGGRPIAPDKNALEAAKQGYLRRIRG